MNTNTTVALLPPGLADQLPPEARRSRLLHNRVIECFSSFGYQEVSPPLMEFEDSLFQGSAAALSQQTFRLMDPVSHQMLGLRTDMTMQVARIATTRLTEEKLPLRLCYSGPCLRVTGEGLRKERQVVQAGAELIGNDTTLADIEILRCAVSALEPLELGDITIDINLPRLVDIILSSIEATELNAYKQAIAHKDLSGLSSLPEPQQTAISRLLETTGCSADDAIWRDIIPLLDENAAGLLTTWLGRVIAIEQASIPARISLDVLEHQGFEYYSGMAFALFAEKADSEVGRGGCYMLNQETPAVGFTLFLHQLRNAVVETGLTNRCYILPGNDETNIAALRQKGWTTIYALDSNADERTAARTAGCTHIMEHGELLPLTEIE